MSSAKLQEALAISAHLGSPINIYEYETHIHLCFNERVRASFYYHVNGKLEEIHLVDCDIDHEKVTHRFRSVGLV
jgi:hypothetical protein